MSDPIDWRRGICLRNARASHNKVPGELRSLFYEHLERIKLPKDPRHKPFLESPIGDL
jgi:hypothetical protein